MAPAHQRLRPEQPAVGVELWLEHHEQLAVLDRMLHLAEQFDAARLVEPDRRVPHDDVATVHPCVAGGVTGAVDHEPGVGGRVSRRVEERDADPGADVDPPVVDVDRAVDGGDDRRRRLDRAASVERRWQGQRQRERAQPTDHRVVGRHPSNAVDDPVDHRPRRRRTEHALDELDVVELEGDDGAGRIAVEQVLDGLVEADGVQEPGLGVVARLPPVPPALVDLARHVVHDEERPVAGHRRVHEPDCEHVVCEGVVGSGHDRRARRGRVLDRSSNTCLELRELVGLVAQLVERARRRVREPAGAGVVHRDDHRFAPVVGVEHRRRLRERIDDHLVEGDGALQLVAGVMEL